VLIGIFRAVRDRNSEGLPTGEFLDRTPLEELRQLVGRSE
jgi:hypothetical protein